MDLTSLHVRRAVAGSPDSMEWVIVHFDPMLDAQIRMRLRGTRATSEDVHDLRSDVWVVVLEKVGRLVPRDERIAPVLARFLSTTSLHVCNNFIRRHIRHRVSAPVARPEESSQCGRGMDAFSVSTIDVFHRACQTEERRRIAAALAALPDEYRDVVILRLLEQRTNQEIAQELALQPNTVAVRYKRALEKLRVLLAGASYGELWSLHRFRRTESLGTEE